MIVPRIIPALLLDGEGLVKGTRFSKRTYVGDPINAVKIFNEKSVDELVFLDISAREAGRLPPIDLVRRIADECYMPFCVGGGINTVDDMRELIASGAEKVVLNTRAIADPDLITRAASTFGNQSIVVAIDCRKTGLTRRHTVWAEGANKKTGLDPVAWAIEVEKRGAGEILLTSVDCEGTMSGYDLDLIRSVADAVNVPVIAQGGAGSIDDLGRAVRETGASAAAAGSMFVFHGPRRAVLISFPDPGEVAEILGGPHG